MVRPSLRIQSLLVCAALLGFASGALALTNPNSSRPLRAFGTRVVVEGLGPVVDTDGEKSLTALRLLNPQPYDITAVVAGSRLVVPADAVVELDTLIGTVVVRSSDELVVTSHTMDLGSDALNTSTDVQRSGRSLSVTANATVLVTTNSVACKYGFSYAYVEPVAGATYTWSTTGTNVSEGVGTNMVKLLHTGANTASVSVVVTANGSSNTGSASIVLRDPFRISELSPSATSVTPGSPVTISWAIGANEIPRTQVLKINGTAGRTLHTPASGRPGKATTSIDGWNRDALRVGAPWLVDRDGAIIKTFDDSGWIYHLGLKGTNARYDKQLVAIEFANELALDLDGDRLYAFGMNTPNTIYTGPFLNYDWRGFSYFCHSNCRADKTDLCLPEWVYEKIQAAGIRLQS